MGEPKTKCDACEGRGYVYANTREVKMVCLDCNGTGESLFVRALRMVGRG